MLMLSAGNRRATFPTDERGDTHAELVLRGGRCSSSTSPEWSIMSIQPGET